VKRME
jgi:hypothetical protein